MDENESVAEIPAEDHHEQEINSLETTEEQLETSEKESPNLEKGKAEETEETEDEHILVIDDEETPSSSDPAPAWVKELRKNHRKTAKENRELREQLKKFQSPNKVDYLGEKPKLEDFDYDPDKFEKSLTEWHDKRRRIEEQQRQQSESNRRQQEAWNKRINHYNESKNKLKFRDVEDAELIVQSALNNTQQGLIVQGADDPALVVYALSKNSKKLNDLANIDDPVRFAFEVGKMEANLKIKTRKATTKPEKVVSGTGSISGSVDSTLEKLRADAEKTGDYTKVHQYRRTKRKA